MTTSPFPPQWSIHPIGDFDLFKIESEEEALGVQMAIRLAPGHLSVTHTRWCVFGYSPITVRFDVALLIPSFPDKTMRIYLQATTDDITPPPNSTTTKWLDIEKLLREGKVLT